MKPDTMNNDPAFPVMAMDILSNVLSRADNPSELGTYLTEEIRDLTGARCALLIQCLCTATVTPHRVVAVNPVRRREWAESPAVNRLYDIVHHMPAARFWRGDEPSEVAGLLRREGFELSMAFPLNAGAFRVGAMLVLGLPDEEHISSVHDLLNNLSVIVALVLRNSFLFERQEQIIQERTEELSTSEEKYRTLIESANDAVFINEITEDGMPGPFIEVNELACRRLGYSRGEFSQMSPMELDDPRYRNRIALAMERLLKEGHAVFETAQMAKGGRSIPVEVSTRVLELMGKRLLFSIVRDITERKRAEKALNESEAKYMDLYENAPDMYASVNARTALIERCNNTLSSALGYTKEEIIGRQVFEIYHPDCLEEVQKAFKSFLDTGEVRDKELQLQRKDGSRLDISLNVSSVHDKDGHILYSRSTLRDISESKRNHAINASRLHLLQFAATHSLNELHEETLNEAEKLTDSRIGFYHFVDDDQESLTLQNWSTRTKTEFCKAEGQDLHYPLAEAGVWVDCVYQRKAVIHNDYASLPHRKGMPEGHAAVIRELVVPVLRGDKIRAILGVGNKPSDYIEKDVEAVSLLADLAWEIAERKRAEEAKQRESALLRCLIDSASDLIYVKNRDSVYLRCNKASEKFIGLSESEQIGKTDFDFFDREKAEAIQKLDRQVLAEGKQLRTEEWVADRDGGRMLLDTLKAPYYGPNGEVMGLVGISRDITDRRRAEDERMAYLRFLESMDRVNRAMQGTTNLEQMMSDVLDVALSIFDCDRAFLFYPCDPEASAWKVPMERNRPEYPGALTLGLVVPMDEEVSEQLWTLLNSDGPVKFGPGSGHPLPKDVSERFGFKSLMSMALYPKVGKPWHFGLHQCSHPRVWTPEEERLLQEIGRRLEDGLTSLLAYHDLRESEAKYRRIVDTATEGIWAVGPDTMTTFVNAHMAEMLGCSGEEMIGRPLTDFMFEEDAPDHLRKIENRRQGTSESYERRFRRQDGQTVWTHVSATPIFDADRHFKGSFAMFTDITDHKRAEEKLLELSQMLQLVLDNMPAFVFWKDRNSVYLGCNRLFAANAGLSSAEKIAGLTDLDLPWKHDEAESYRTDDRTVMGTGVPKLNYEETQHTADGRVTWVRTSKIPLKDLAGNVIGVLGTFEDITERKRAEEALRKKTEELDRYFTTALDLLCIADTDGYFIRLNPEWESTLGFSVSELEGRRFLDFVHPDDMEATLQALSLLAGQNEVLNFINRYRCKNGTYRWIEWRSYPSGTRIYAVARDITTRKEAEEEIQRLKNYLGNIIDSMPSILVGMDQCEVVTQWNRQAEEISGISATAAVGRPITELLPDFSPWIKGMRSEIDQQRAASMEKLLIEKEGERRFYDLMLYPLTSNGVEGAVVRIEDVTERARIQELIIQTEKMMSVGGLAAGMAHEINNPLGIITQAAQNIERRVSPELPANRKAAEELGVSPEGIKAYFEKRQIPEFIGSIREASLRASRIITNMLQFSRRAGTTMEPVSPAGIIEQALELAASDYDLKKKYDFRIIEIIRDYAPNMPEVPMVAVEMEQVMLNLLKNAAQAMTLTSPDRRPRITLRLRWDKRYALIEVEDNGPGMEEEVRRRAFEPFFTTKEPGMGTGLGLSVSYMIVTQNHKGLMEVESKPGKGACFRVRLPLSKESICG